MSGKNNQMNALIGVALNLNGLEQTQQALENYNSIARETATTLGKLNVEAKKLSSSNNNMGMSKDITKLNQDIKNLMNGMKSGTESASETLTKLNNKYKELQKELNATSDVNKQNQLKAVMAKNITAIEQTEAQIRNIKRASLNEQVATNDTAIKAQIAKEKDKVNQYKKIWQEELNNYKNVQAQKSASSSLNDFSQVGGSGLRQNIFNAAISLTGVRALTAELQNLGAEIVDINYNTINTQRIMGDFSDETARNLEANAVAIAKSTNIQITDAQDIQSAWVRINDSYAQNTDLLTGISDLTSKFMNVGEIENAEDAVKLLNASLLQFNVSAEDALLKSEEFLNKWAYMADITAMGTADEFGSAISRYGANIESMNGGMDEAIALASIMADKLAKNGDEAGTSLKTFTSYVSRTKTRSLFADIANDLGDVDYKLADSNGKLKDFDGMLRSIAQAYDVYKTGGNDVMAQKILEAVGATRQRDVALATLNSVNDGSYDEYLTKLEDTSKISNYLEEQNSALMETFSAKFNELRVSIQEFVMMLGNSGILNIFSGIMGVASVVMSTFANLHPVLQKTLTAFLAYKAIGQVAGWIGHISGATNKLNMFLQQGTKAEIENANAVSANANAYMARMTYMGQNNQLSQNAVRVLFQQKTALDNLTSAYNNGEINANQYSTSVKNLIGEKQLETEATARNTGEILKNNNAKQNHIGVNGKVINSNKQSKVSKDNDTLSTKRNNLENENSNKSHGRLSTLIGKTTIATNAHNVALKAKTLGTNFATFATELLNGATVKQALATVTATTTTSLFASAVSFLGASFSFTMSCIMPIISIISLVSLLFGGFSESVDDSGESLEDLQGELEETRKRIDELNSLRSAGKITDAENEELAHLEKTNDELERRIKLQKELEASKMLFGDSDNENGNTSERSKDVAKDIKSSVEDYEKYAKLVKEEQIAIANLQEVIQSSESGAERTLVFEKLRQAQMELDNYKEKLQGASSELKKQSGIAGEASSEWDRYKSSLKGDELRKAVEQAHNLTTAIESIPEEALFTKMDGVIKNFEIGGFVKEVNEANEAIKNIDGDIEKLFDGSATREDLQRMVADYRGFSEQVGKSTKDQILFLNSLKEKHNGDISSTIQTQLDELYQEQTTLQKLLSDNLDGKIELDTQEVEDAKNRLEALKIDIQDVESMAEIQLQVNLESPDLSGFVSGLQSAVQSTKDLVDAQNKLAKGTALSKQELLSLANVYPELLYQANIFADGSVGGQYDAISAVLDMKNQETNTSIDLKIAELEAQKSFVQSILDLEVEKQNMLLDATVQEANGEMAIKGDVQDFLTQYNNVIGEQHTLAKQYELDKSKEAGDKTVSISNETGEKQVESSGNAGQGIADNIINGAKAGADGMQRNAGAVSGIFNKIISWCGTVADNIANALAGKRTGGSAGGVGGGDGTNTFSKSVYDQVSGTINGQSMTSWITLQQEQLKKNIESYKVSLGQINNAIGNLEGFKDQGLGGLNNNYGGSSGGSGGSGGSSGGGQSSADKALEEAIKAIERLTEQYIKNVESMQDRIAKALKKKYQEQYDERKKLLEKEHNERLDQIQAEIDKINGDRPEDKQSELERLQSQYNKWRKDDSTLGKQKQKEYLDAIKELEKEIKLDELQDQMDKENEDYQNSIDKDSEFYDTLLKKLDDQMTDEQLYREANDMIRNEKIQEITDLLTEFDAKWDGWATLMGKTAGEIVAEEVKNAINNYKDVNEGTVTPDGGKHTGGGSSAPSTGGSSGGSSSSSGGTVSKGTRVKITDGNANMYRTYNSGGAVNNWRNYAGQPLYVVNDKGNRYAVSKDNNINNALGWVNKQNVQRFNTGGYTGNSEGLAYLDKKERVLDASVTKSFDFLIFDFLPTISKSLLNPNSGDKQTNNNVQFNKELVSIKVDKVINNTQFEADNQLDNLDRMLRKSLQKSGITIKR